MTPSAPPIFSRWQPAQLALFGTLAIFLVMIPFGLLNVVQKTNSDIAPRYGGFDLHPYWFNAHFLWQGENPYKAMVKQAHPDLPLNYLDGVRVTEGSVFEADLGNRAPNTATIMWLIAPLARLSWQTAKPTWLILNYLFLLGSGWLLLKLLPPTSRLTNWHKVAIVLLGLSLWASRSGLIYGQTLFLVFMCLLGALYFRSTRPFVAGLLLGLALSKYSIAIVAVLVLLFEQRWLIVAVAGIIQIAATWLVTVFDGSSFFDTVRVYVGLATDHITEGGINVNRVIADPTLQLGSAVVVLLLLGIFVLAWMRHRNLPMKILRHRLVSFHLLVLFSLWSLQTLYHLNYDMMIAQSALVLLIYGLPNQIWRLSPRQESGLWGVVVGSVFLISVPDRVMTPLFNFFPPFFQWGSFRSTIWMCAMFVLIAWLFWRLKPSTLSD